MRLIDADKLKPDRMTEKGLAISQSQIADAPTINNTDITNIERRFIELVVEYPNLDLCAYPEYKGKPYYSIKYCENEEIFVGYGTYKPEVLSRYLRDYFFNDVTSTPF